MGTLPKNLLLALTLVCVIALVAFFIQLIVINTGVDPDEPPTTISGTQDEDDLVSGEPDSTETPTPFGPPIELVGTRRELSVYGNRNLIIYAEDGRFDFSESESTWRFEFTGLGTASLEINLMIISEQGLEADAFSFLRSYTGGLDVEAGGEVQIQNSAMRGYYVTAHSEQMIYEAWFYDLQTDNRALAFVIYYGIELQRDALFRVLGSMSITHVQESAPDTENDNEPDDEDGEE
ncbi:MAG: hypothetical protein FWC20_02305 [Oscillospiraceae bacterium]|nr:hypothetical protein [Oscillospiraceae bacterium]MCL2278226.1 hypothetical protein [Oscillospiraceae bacterium]